MWYDFDGYCIDLSKVSALTHDEAERKVTFIMDNGQHINFPVAENSTPDQIQGEFTRLLKSIADRDERIMVNSFELLKGILSELKLISQNLRRLS